MGGLGDGVTEIRWGDREMGNQDIRKSEDEEDRDIQLWIAP